MSEVWAVAIGQETGRMRSTTICSGSARAEYVPEQEHQHQYHLRGVVRPRGFAHRTTSALFSRDSKFRGHLFQVVVKHKFTKTLSGLVLAEYCPMGSFYTHTDEMTFLRTELTVTF
ncbi:MAG: hypothetical protein IPL39_11635 [Opitutaceae bacterium]|nr:hypothetical protein [Opitutaceae bacterium]